MDNLDKIYFLGVLIGLGLGICLTTVILSLTPLKSKTLIKPDLEIKQVNGVSDTTYIYYEK